MNSTIQKKYPKYKDSGVEWLGDVPKHWDVKRLKFIANILNGYAFDSNIYMPEGIPIIRIGDVKNPINWEEVKRVPEEMLKSLFRFQVLKGDVLLALTGATIGKSAVYNCDEVALLNQRVGIIRASQINQRFLLYIIQSNIFTKFIDYLCYGGAQENIGKGDIGSIYSGVPSKTEQQAIADFLDRRTGEIDELIAKKERLIELLREKRTAIISHAVTKGLNPDAKMKDSRIDWLRKVPEHWEVKRLKRISKRIQTGCTPPTAQEYYYEDGTISWYGPGNFGDDLILGEASKLINESAIKDGVARLFEAGSTMIVAIGATIGKVGYIDEPASSNQQITAVAPNIAEVLGKFLAYQLKRLEQVLKGIAPNTTLPIMDQQKIGCLMVANPPISEQQAITDFLDRETSKVDVLIAKVTKVIEKLKEYRTALISAAVTGKIDVREKIN